MSSEVIHDPFATPLSLFRRERERGAGNDLGRLRIGLSKRTPLYSAPSFFPHPQEATHFFRTYTQFHFNSSRYHSSIVLRATFIASVFCSLLPSRTILLSRWRGTWRLLAHIWDRMIPVSPHGEFAPTIKFQFRVRPKMLCSYLRSCYRVIKRFRRTISVYVHLTRLDDDCSLVAAGAHIATKSNGYRSSRHHQGVSVCDST